MKSLVLVVHDVPELLPRDVQGSQVIRVQVEFQHGSPERRYMRQWHLGEIEARVVEVTPVIALRSR